MRETLKKGTLQAREQMNIQKNQTHEEKSLKNKQSDKFYEIQSQEETHPAVYVGAAAFGLTVAMLLYGRN